ncbi:exodeoxyribonuclease VII small subunit [Lachnoclostridium sp. An181]|uniref:exodeoxyribonuclease VII small subunit n=1 Tax=Lachnoclostridium sp. An181 TaxID=1965575 RepID=UPI000B3650D1|nr:exodeoxyribonuclease VII small subunit [Lachnoclostridium sp. An181]OUP51200.1 exodeoxyribonuclease VII small subunit [Lachnoclostridium sp. An181]
MEEKDLNLKEQSVEELFEGMDGLLKQMEEQDTSLEETFILYNKGMEMLKVCNEKIDAVEKKILILDENGEKHEF